MQYILFTGPKCPACKTMKANLSLAGIEYSEYDISEPKNKMLAGIYHVRSLPTLVATSCGKTLETIIGSHPVRELEKIREKYQNS